MDTATREKIVSIRKRAMELRMEQNRYLSDRDIVLLLAHALPTTHNLFLADVLKMDLKTRPLIDAVIEWCDTEKGLAKQFPEAILSVAQNILPLEK